MEAQQLVINNYQIDSILSSSYYSIIAACSRLDEMNQNSNRLKAGKHVTSNYIMKITQSKGKRSERLFLQSMNNKNIVCPIECFTYNGMDVIVMEEAYADLYSFLEANDQVSVPVALKLIIDALSALEYLHDNNILHGDIKLENFLLYPIQNDEFYGQKESDMTSGFDLLLSDFETARVIKPNHICKCKRGTAGYISPEFMKGHSLPSDIYAMGVTLRYIWSRTNGQNNRIPIVEDVITSMLAEDPLARPTAKQCRVYIEYLAKRAMGTKMQSYGSSF